MFTSPGGRHRAFGAMPSLASRIKNQELGATGKSGVASVTSCDEQRHRPGKS